MFNFDRSRLRRFAIASIGTVAFTTMFVGAAVAPASAATVISTADDWQKAVERQLESRRDEISLRLEPGKRSEAVLAVRFTPEGDYAGATIARSTGKRMLDRHALQVADNIDYPRLPESMRGKQQTVAMRLYFGRADTPEQFSQMQRDLKSVRIAVAEGAANTVAAK